MAIAPDAEQTQLDLPVPSPAEPLLIKEIFGAEPPERFRRRRDEDYPRRSRRREDYQDDYEDEDEEEWRAPRRSGQKARRLGRNASLWFIAAGIATLGAVTVDFITLLIVAPNGALATPEFLGVCIRMLTFVIGGIFQLLAAAAWRSLQLKRTASTGIVFAFITGLLSGLGALGCLLRISQIAGAWVLAFVLTAILNVTTSFLNLFAAILGVATMNNPAVARRFRE